MSHQVVICHIECFFGTWNVDFMSHAYNLVVEVILYCSYV